MVICLQYRRPRFNPWVGKIPWRRKRQPTPVFLPGEFHRQRSLVGYSPWGHNELDMTEWLILSAFNHFQNHSHSPGSWFSSNSSGWPSSDCMAAALLCLSPTRGFPWLSPRPTLHGSHHTSSDIQADAFGGYPDTLTWTSHKLYKLSISTSGWWGDGSWLRE